MTYVNIEDYEDRNVTSEANENDSWSHDSYHTDHSIVGFRVSKYQSGDLPIDFEPVAGQNYYLLYALYSTGDSFHNQSGVIEYIGLYQDERVAIQNETRIELVNAGDRVATKAWRKNNGYSIVLVTEQGKEYEMAVPWKGYFEGLDSINILPIGLLE